MSQLITFCQSQNIVFNQVDNDLLCISSATHGAISRAIINGYYIYCENGLMFIKTI